MFELSRIEHRSIVFLPPKSAPMPVVSGLALPSKQKQVFDDAVNRNGWPMNPERPKIRVLSEVAIDLEIDTILNY